MSLANIRPIHEGEAEKMTKEDAKFDKDVFMEAQWARLAALYGVSVEEVKSDEFDERLKKEFEEQRNREAAIDKRENADMWRAIFTGGIFAGIIAALGWFALSSHGWWFPIPGLIVAFLFISIEEEATKQVKRDDYPNDAERYWDRVQSALTHSQLTSVVIAFVVVLFLVLALG